MFFKEFHYTKLKNNLLMVINALKLTESFFKKCASKLPSIINKIFNQKNMRE